MLNAVIKFALRHRPLIVAAALVVLGYGGYLATTTPIDVFPDLDRPRVVVITECPGLAPEEVETLVTYPLEASLLGAAGVQDVRTQSGFGLSVVTVEFGWGTEVRAARQVVQERLATVTGGMPEGVRPQLAPMSSLMGQFLIAGLRRQQGPHGGDLLPIASTKNYAERVVVPVHPGPLAAAVGAAAAYGGPPLTRADLYAWTPVDRRNPAGWQPVAVVGANWSTRVAGGSQAVRAEVGGQPQRLVFPSELQRQLDLRTLADWVIRPRLLKVTGVAQVVTIGAGRKQYQVLVDPTALHEYKVTLQEVEAALRASNVNYTGGFADAGGFEKPIRVIGRLGPRPEQVLADLNAIPIKILAPTPTTAGEPVGATGMRRPPAASPGSTGPRPGFDRPVLLRDVAQVVEGPQVKRGDATVNGVSGVVLTVTKQPHTDTRGLTTAAQAALREVEPSLPVDVVVEADLYKLRDFIDRGVYNVGEALVVGAVLVLLILFVFLLNVRTTFISLAAIPLSLAVTVIVFRLVGWVSGVELSINVMTLGGIAVAMGELVDDAIVDVENIFRRLRENSQSAAPRPALRVVYEASLEVRSAIVFGTAVVVLVFLPLFALSGIEGRLFAPLGVAYIVSILASLVISLTVTPVLSYYLLAGSRAAHRERDGLLVRGLKWGAAHLVRFSMRRAGLLLVLTWALVAYCGWRLTTLGADFLPQFDEGTVQVNVTLPAGASLNASNRATAAVDRKLASLQKTPANPNGEVISFLRRTGRAELDEHADPPNANEYYVTINPACGKSRREVIDLLREAAAAEAPGTDVEVEQPLAHLMSHMLSGSTAQIAIKVFGDDLDTLEATANRIKTAITGIPGVSSLAVEPIRRVDEVHVKLRPADLASHGVDRAYVGAFVQTALNGEVVSQVVEGQRRFDLVVRLSDPYRADIAQFRELRVDLPGGRRQVRLKDLADVTPMTGGDAGANQVKRENIRRRVVVRCNATGRDLASVVADIRREVDKQLELPPGYFVEYGGQFEAQQRATRLIGVLAIVAVAGMFLVLTMLFPSGRIVLQILNAIPTAFIGGVLALIITGQTLTVASLVGFISLGGIAVRNGVLLVTHYLHLMRHEGEMFTEHMVLRGSLERLSPVLMTALTAGIALVPLVVVGHEPGREILYPVATVILGGLITSTFCEFLLHPGLFWRFSGKSAVALALGGESADGLDHPPTPTHEPQLPHGAATDGPATPPGA